MCTTKHRTLRSHTDAFSNITLKLFYFVGPYCNKHIRTRVVTMFAKKQSKHYPSLTRKGISELQSARRCRLRPAKLRGYLPRNGMLNNICMELRNCIMLFFLPRNGIMLFLELRNCITLFLLPRNGIMLFLLLRDVSSETLLTLARELFDISCFVNASCLPVPA